MLRVAVLSITLLALADARVFLGKLSELVHEVSGNVYAESCSQLVIENFYYDGLGPMVFAFVGTDPESGPTGASSGADATVVFKDEEPFKRFLPGRRYDNDTLRITLPPSYHLNQIRWLSIWCRQVRADFGSIRFASGDQVIADVCNRKVFCQQLREGYDVCWSVNTAGQEMQVTLCSDTDILAKNKFMGFGISKFPTTTLMFNSDPTLCWRDDEDKWTIEDYYISDYAQCGSSRGSVTGVCQDTRYTGGVDNLRMAKGEVIDGVACCTYTRPLSSNDTDHDNPITLAGPQAVVWAIGPVNRGVILKHPNDFRAIPDVLVDFANGSTANLCDKISTEQCCKDRYSTPANATTVEPTSTPAPQKCKPCSKRRNNVGSRRTKRFVFTIGPSGDECGYEKLTNSSGGWGIAWYVDGCLIPHLKVQRGKTYKFCVLGGNDTSVSSRYHPLYLTSSPIGGYFQNKESGMMINETIYAGIGEEDNPLFTGPLYEHNSDDIKRCCTRYLRCPKGAREFKWRPNRNTPDELYYQCATHYFLGWKISVMNG